jgi:hypothetical protein
MQQGFHHGLGFAALRMLAVAPQLDALTFLLAVLAAVLAVRTAFDDRARTGWMSAFVAVSHGVTSRSEYWPNG